MYLFNYPCRSILDETSMQRDRDTTGLAQYLNSLWDDPLRRSQLMLRKASLRLPDITEDAFPTLLDFLRSRRCLLYALVLEDTWVGNRGWDERAMAKWLEDLGLHALYVVLSGSYVKSWKHFIETDEYDRLLGQLVLFDSYQTSHLQYEGTTEAQARLAQYHENAIAMYTTLENKGLA